ncbi:GlcG/HbpS family heme-binding protein [Mucilaginibacter glaciei]|uniref:Heme-binding protein n=1 Tax=Mucilaginibacter glaciei TaxID=2772109 RepID=A0A926S658_9SPHI|nr:heme-binding protein [Mucilaginibacter glaciei]MBD1393416.1 heme-binding protein [Mucilaginibacter glaciei]
MNQELINQLLHRALDEAGRLNIAITVSVVDNGGHLVALLRQENCSYFGIAASRKKAVTASQLKLPSHVLNGVIKQFPELQRSLDHNNDIELLPGGFPVVINSIVIGGLGISGGNFDQDRIIGEYAIKVI